MRSYMLHVFISIYLFNYMFSFWCVCVTESVAKWELKGKFGHEDVIRAVAGEGCAAIGSYKECFCNSDLESLLLLF